MNKSYNFDCPYCGELLKSFECNDTNVSKVPNAEIFGTIEVRTDIKYLVNSTSSYDSYGVTWSLRNLLFRNWSFEKAWNVCDECTGVSYIPIFAKPDISSRKDLYNLSEFYPRKGISSDRRWIKGANSYATVIHSKYGIIRSDGQDYKDVGLKVVYLDPMPDGSLFLELPNTFKEIITLLSEVDFINNRFNFLGSMASVFEFFRDICIRPIQVKIFFTKLKFRSAVFSLKPKKHEYEASIEFEKTYF